MTATTHQPCRRRVTGDLLHGQIPTGSVYVGRSAPGLTASRYANPHRVGDCRICDRVHDLPDALDAYARHLAAHPDLIAAARTDLAGADLACWCPPDRPCHADVLLALVNRMEVAR
ncbi:MAG TPA: DUF4326 domain-containing protein [Actinokineospora sp.]|nr:DUF4326 domain-containing protein [Actinokineospora sp.]